MARPARHARGTDPIEFRSCTQIALRWSGLRFTSLRPLPEPDCGSPVVEPDPTGREVELESSANLPHAPQTTRAEPGRGRSEVKRSPEKPRLIEAGSFFRPSQHEAHL